LNDNQIPSLDGIEAALAGSREKLTTIYLERNPCVSISRLLYLFFESSYESERKPRCDHDLNISSVTYDLIIILIVASIFLIEDYCDSPCFLYNIYFSQNNFLCVLSKYAMLDFFFNSRVAFCRIQWCCEVSRVIELIMNNKTCFH